MTPPFLLELEARLPEDSFPWVASALLHDPLVWDALHSPLGKAALNRLGGNPLEWNPAALAEIAAEVPPSPAAEGFAAAVALAEEIDEALDAEEDATPIKKLIRGAPPSRARTAAAIALARAEAPDALLHALVAAGAHRAALHALLAQPKPPTAQAVAVSRLMAWLPPEQALPLLWELRRSHPKVARMVSEHSRLTTLPRAFTQWQSALAAASRGEIPTAEESLNAARASFAQLVAELAAQQAQLAAQAGDTQGALEAWRTALAAAPQNPVYRACYALALADNEPQQAAKSLPKSDAAPILIARAYATHFTAPETAREKALRALQSLPDAPLTPRLATALIEVLVAVGELEAAARAAEFACALSPHKPEAFARAAALFAKLGNRGKSAEAALWATRLEETPANLRLFAAATAQCCPERAIEAYRRLTAAEQQPADLQKFASLAAEQGKYEEARRAAESLLALQPENALALAILGRVEANAGEPEAARAHLERSLAIAPSPQAYIALADVVREQEGLTSALKVLQRAVEALPHSAEIHRALGLLLLEANRPAHALPHLETAFSHEPENPKSLLGLAKAHAALAQFAEVKGLLSTAAEHLGLEASRLLAEASLALGDAQTAVNALSPHITAGETTTGDSLLYAKALMRLGKHKEAVATAQKILAELPAGAAERADALCLLGQVRLAQGEAEQALEAYRAAYRQIPADDAVRRAEAARGVVRAAVAAGKGDAAVEVLGEILPLAPHDAELHALAAQAYAAADRPEDALNAAYAACLLSDFTPREARAYADLAIAQGKATEAAETLRQALARAPENHSLRLALADALLAAENPAEARAALLPMMEAEAVNAEECAEAGERLLRLEAFAEAAECLRRAVQAAEKVPLSWRVGLVRALHALGQFPEAVEHARAALEVADMDENPAVALQTTLAESLLALGRKEEAAEVINSALQAHPDHAKLHRFAITLWQKSGCLRCALEAAERYLAANPQDWAMRAVAAQIARARLLPERARRILANLPAPENGSPAVSDCYLTAAELALEADAEVAAAEMAQSALATGAGGTPRLLALQSRLAMRAGDRPRAEELFAAALGADKETNSPTLEALAEAALELGAWQAAREFAEKAHQALPHSAQAALRNARVAVLAAEAQWRATAVGAIARAPGEYAVGEEARHRWEKALTEAAKALELPTDEVAQAVHPELHRWRMRGEAAFDAHTHAALLHSTHPEDIAAWWSAFRRSGGEEPSPKLPPLAHHLIAFEVALYLEARGSLNAALRAAESATHLNERFAEGYALAARLAFSLQDYERAAAAIKAAVVLADDEPRWHALGGKIFAAGGDFEQAARHFARAAELEPAYLPHRLELADALSRAGRNGDALDALRQAERDFPNSAKVQLALAQTLFRLGRLGEAGARADKALSMGKSTPRALLLRAQIALQTEDYATALSSAQRARQKQGLTPEVAICLARAFAGLGDDNAALDVLEEAVKRGATPELEILRAELVGRTGGNAVTEWRKLARAYPEEPRVWLGLAKALADAGEASEAQKAARQALPLAESLSARERGDLHLLLGRLAAQDGHLDQAVHHFTEALHAVPESAEAWLALGRAQAKRGLYKEALEAYEQARRRAPQDPLPYYHAALAAKEIRDFELAEELLREAARLAPDNLAIQRQLAAVSVINLVN